LDAGFFHGLFIIVKVHDAMGGYELFEYDLARELNIHPRKDDKK